MLVQVERQVNSRDIKYMLCWIQGFLQFPSLQGDRNMVCMQSKESLMIFYWTRWLIPSWSTWAGIKKTKKQDLFYIWWIPPSQNYTNPPSAFGQVREKCQLRELFCVTERAAQLILNECPHLFMLTPLGNTWMQTLCMSTCLTQQIIAGS